MFHYFFIAMIPNQTEKIPNFCLFNIIMTNEPTHTTLKGRTPDMPNLASEHMPQLLYTRKFSQYVIFMVSKTSVKFYHVKIYVCPTNFNLPY